jgi:hypothetical protein
LTGAVEKEIQRWKGFVMNETTMTPQRTNRGVSGLNIVLGIWVIISPFVLAFTQYPVAMWNNIAVGCAVTLCALVRTSSTRNQNGWSWLNVLLGAWLLISSFVLGFATLTVAMWNNIIIGVLTIIIAASTLAVARPRAPMHA